MAEQDKQVAFRFPAELVERLDRYAQRMGAEMPGLKFSRADAVRVLLERGLEETGLGAGPKGGKRAARARRPKRSK